MGKTSFKKVKSIIDGPYHQIITKSLTCTESDYQKAKVRQTLDCKCGFNLKGYSFLREDFHFTVKDYMKLYKVEEKHSKELNEIYKPVKDIYGITT